MVNTAGKPVTDWQAVERDYRAGILSLREMAAAHKVSHVSIKKHADKAGWTRDLSAKIQAKADELVNKAAVNRSANTASAVSERQIIEANAERIARVRGEHRGDINRMRTLGLTLLGELESQSANPEDLEKLGEILRAPDERGTDKLNDLYQKIISTPGRIDGAKKVAETLKIAIGLEREAYGIDPKDGGNDPAGAGASRILSDAERASRLASIIERARQRAKDADAA